MAAMIHISGADDPEVAVVIPVYRQPLFLKDAVFSVWHQTIAGQVALVIVNDGCPDPRTDVLGRLFARQAGRRTIYLRTTNRGPSAARNSGILFALDVWPTVRAVLVLDADNMLEPHTLKTMWDRLCASPPSVGWVYPDFQLFGESHTYLAMPGPFSRHRLLHHNYCDTGSLVRRSVFEAGCWYDEQMPGNEDWELFIHGMSVGFTGVRAPRAGFLYRRQGGSRGALARRRRAEIVSHIRHKYPALYGDRSIRCLEREEFPRFLVLGGEHDVRVFSEPESVAPRPGGLQLVLEDICANVPIDIETPYLPPVTIVMSSADFDHFRSLPGAAWVLGEAVRLLADGRTARVSLRAGRRAGLLTMRGERQVGIVLRTSQLISIAYGGASRRTKRVYVESWTSRAACSDLRELMGQVVAGITRRVEARVGREQVPERVGRSMTVRYKGTHTEYADRIVFGQPRPGVDGLIARAFGWHA